MQWQAFTQDYLKECGLTVDACPIDRSRINHNQVKTHFAGVHQFCWLGCGRVNRHVDGALVPRYTAILLIQNTGLIAKLCSHSKRDIAPQVPGTILVLDIHKYHHCIADKRIVGNARSPLLLAVDTPYQEKPQQQEVEEKFRNFLKEFRMLTTNMVE